MDLKKYMIERKETFEKFMEDYFEKHLSCTSTLKESMIYSLRAGGKRLRPVLVLAASEACKGKLDAALPCALALEMIHTFSLIHDDLPAMDNDDLRRGKPTNHKVFGEAVAILAGDALLSEAFSCLALLYHSGPVNAGDCLASLAMTHNCCHRDEPAGRRGDLPNVAEIIRDIADATGARGMTGGQVLDLDGEGKKVPLAELEEIHRLKTGALIRVSLTSGAKSAGASKEQVEALRFYGEKIGLAFQIADDILDVTATTEELGKPAKSDIENEKSTYPALLGLEKSRELADSAIKDALAALAHFGPEADPLRAIAKYIVERKS